MNHRTEQKAKLESVDKNFNKEGKTFELQFHKIDLLKIRKDMKKLP